MYICKIKLRHREQRVPIFYDLASFVESASESAKDPVFSKLALSRCMHTIGSIDIKGNTNNKPLQIISGEHFV